MLKKNRTMLTITGCLLALGLTTGARTVRAMVNDYSDACSPLGGVPGLLQTAGIIPSGNCKSIVHVGKIGLCSGKLCKSVKGIGECARVGRGKDEYCACVPGVISR